MRKAIVDVNHPNTEVKTSNRLGQRPWILGLVMETLWNEFNLMWLKYTEAVFNPYPANVENMVSS